MKPWKGASIVSDPSLAPRRVLVTGVSSGLGRATALALVRDGAQVLGTARRQDLGEELERSAGTPNLRFVPADICRPSECERLVAACIDFFGGLDVLINNAGARTTPPIRSLHEIDETDWDTVVDTNLKGPFFLTRYALKPMLAARRGLVINISSQTAEQATAGMAPYAASKAGLIGLTRSIAVEYLDDGIRANAVILGGTATGQEARTMDTRDSGSTPATRVGATKRFEARLYTSEEVARTLVLLTREDAAPITGASIAIDHAVTAGSLTSAYIHEVIDRASQR